MAVKLLDRIAKPTLVRVLLMDLIYLNGFYSSQDSHPSIARQRAYTLVIGVRVPAGFRVFNLSFYFLRLIFRSLCFLGNMYSSDLMLTKISSTGSGEPLEGCTWVRLDRQILTCLYRR